MGEFLGSVGNLILMAMPFFGVCLITLVLALGTLLYDLCRDQENARLEEEMWNFLPIVATEMNRSSHHDIKGRILHEPPSEALLRELSGEWNLKTARKVLGLHKDFGKNMDAAARSRKHPNRSRLCQALGMEDDSLYYHKPTIAELVEDAEFVGTRIWDFGLKKW